MKLCKCAFSWAVLSLVVLTGPELPAQIEAGKWEALIQEVDQLVLSNHQEKALKILVPLYYKKLQEGKTDLPFQQLTYQFARILERTQQHQEALEVTTRWINSGSFAPYYLTRLYIVQALVYEKIGDKTESRRALYKAKNLLNYNNWLEVRAEYLVRLSSFHRVFGNLDSARYFAIKALPVALQSENHWHIADSYLLMAFTDTNWGESVKNLRKALASYEEMRDTGGIGFMHLNLFSTFFKNAKPNVALAYLDSAGRYAQTNHFLALRASYQADLAMYLEKRGDYKKALEAYKLSSALDEKLKKQDQRAVLYNERYKMEHARQEELHALRESNEVEKMDRRSERNAFILYLAVLGGMSFLILYFYFIQRRQGRLILQDRQTIESRNKELQSLLGNNKLLLNELQHRVKNNLQFIISMISMQMENAKTAASREALESVMNRVGAIASVHDKLYIGTDEASALNQREFIENILENLKKFINIREVNFKLNIDDFLLDTPRTIALGFIITELVTNSSKHAFRSNRKIGPVIQISLEEGADNFARFDYRDNGTGARNPKSEGLGIQLIHMFAEQLKASPEMDFNNGFHLSMNFPIEKH